MKKVFFGLVVGLLAGGAGAWIFLRHHGADEPESKKEEHKEESRVQHGTNGETFLKLDKDAQEHAGLKTAALEAAELKPEVKAFGRVLDPALLATAMTDIAAAHAQLNASTKEFDRMKVLYNQNQNVSARALENAEAAVTRDRIAVEVVETRFAATWGRSMGERKDLGAFVHALISQEAALVRIDVPVSERLGGTPTVARVSSIALPEILAPAEFVGAAISADPQTLGSGFLYLLKTNSLAVNTAVIAWISLPGEAENGVIVPRDAIVRHESAAFIYLQTGEDTFAREEIKLEHPLDKGWFVGALKSGTKVVIAGAQQLLSEELKGEGGGE